MSNRLIIPEVEADLEAMRNDLRKLISLTSESRGLNEAISAGMLSLLDRVSVLEARTPDTVKSIQRCLVCRHNSHVGLCKEKGCKCDRIVVPERTPDAREDDK